MPSRMGNVQTTRRAILGELAAAIGVTGAGVLGYQEKRPFNKAPLPPPTKIGSGLMALGGLPATVFTAAEILKQLPKIRGGNRQLQYERSHTFAQRIQRRAAVCTLVAGTGAGLLIGNIVRTLHEATEVDRRRGNSSPTR